MLPLSNHLPLCHIWTTLTTSQCEREKSLIFFFFHMWNILRYLLLYSFDKMDAKRMLILLIISESYGEPTTLFYARASKILMSLDVLIFWFSMKYSYLPMAKVCPEINAGRPEVFYKKGVFKIFAKFTGKHLFQRLFL